MTRTESKPAAPELPLDSADAAPAELWSDYFEKRTPSAETVRRLVDHLHRGEKHEHVIALIEAAIIHGRSEPWMYEVLALTMEVAGRPKEEIERVLLSSADFAAHDGASMTYLAAYLTRFGRDEQALQLYRQTSRIEPTRPEPYLLGLKLARRLKDPEAVEWAASGILMYDWTKDHARQHRDAENAAAEAEQWLRQSGRGEDADRLKLSMDEARYRDLVVRLEWSGAGDIDLIIEEPFGTVCSAVERHSPGGGVLTHDGHGPSQKNCYEEYICPRGAAGEYRITVRHVWGDIVGKRARLIVIRNQGTPEESVCTHTILVGRDDTVVRVSLARGRRTELSPVHKEESAELPRRKPSTPQLMQMLGGNPTPIGAGGRGSAGVGYQPVVSVISEGVAMSALAVVSGDRRYVRISTVPSFTSITDVFTFSFFNTGQ